MDVSLQLREALYKVQVEYIETPHLKLTARQVQRLWSLPDEACEAALTVLVRQGFLTQAAGGAYVRPIASRPFARHLFS